MTTLEAPRTVALRLADRDDAATISALTQAAYAEYAQSEYPSSVVGETAEDVQAALDTGRVYAVIAELDGEAVGSVRFRFDDDVLYFFRLGLLPTARGQGIAQMLLAYLEAAAKRRGAARIRCKVRCNVARNVRLYETLGYVAVDEETVHRGNLDIVLNVMDKRFASLPPRCVSGD